MNFKQYLKEIYYYLPQKFRMNKDFYKLYNFYSEAQYWSYKKHREYQMEELKKIISYAYNHTKYYKNLFDEYDIKLSQIQDFNDIKKIPILTKKIVSENLNDFIPDNIDKNKLIYVTTGGSTGKPLGFYITKKIDIKRMVFEWINWNMMGYHIGDKCVVLRGNVINNNWYKYDRNNNYLYLSTYDMIEENLDKYLKKIVEFSPKFIRGYPSALEIMAKYILENNIIFNSEQNIKAISTSSETLYESQKVIIEKAFNCPIYDKYGNCEQVGVIGMCKKGVYHDFMEHSYLEYIDDKGNDTEYGESSTIVGTSFINTATLFIRYNTGDKVKLNKQEKCVCGMDNNIIEKLEGRKGDLIKTYLGNFISITALNTHSDIFDNTVRIQYYQDTPGVVILKIIKKYSYTENDTKKIKSELQTKFKNQVDLVIEFVDDIPLTKRGKYKYLDQRLNF